jgi:streptogramin lyase
MIRLRPRAFAALALVALFGGSTASSHAAATPPALDIKSMAKGQDGNVWFTAKTFSEVGKITPSGSVSLYSIPGSVQPSGIASGPGGSLYFAEGSGNALGHITTGGKISQVALPAGAGNDQVAAAGPPNTLGLRTSPRSVS